MEVLTTYIDPKILDYKPLVKGYFLAVGGEVCDGKIKKITLVVSHG